MVRHLSEMRFRGWKGALAAFVGAGAVAWHVMACVESPMSFSPTGDLAFVVADPYGYELSELAGEHVYRLMVLTKDGELREIERTSSHMLTAPAYSPDGERFAYLRIPLLTPEHKTRIGAFIEERKEQYEQATSGPAAEKWIFVAPGDPVPGSPQGGMKDWKDMGLPPFEQFEELTLALEAGGGVIPADLVVRQASTGEPVKSLPVEVPIFKKPDDMTYFFSYVLARPQYSPDGRWVYFGMNYFALAASPATGKKRLLAVNTLPLLSPDGETLATLFGKSLGFLKTDGERAAYVRLRHEVSLSGLAWIDNETLLALGEGDQKKEVVLDVYNVDGHLLRSETLPVSVEKGKGDEGQLAVSPDGDYMAISFAKAVHFLTGDGQVLGSWQPEDESEQLVQPTFTPDSRQVAFKLLAQEKTEGETWTGTVAIVFFTTEGRELFRVPLPRAPRDEVPEPPAPATKGTEQ